jgi:hypothetical protein
MEMKDGLYRVSTPYLCAGFVVEGGVVVRCAPILKGKIEYWKTVAQYVEASVGVGMRVLVYGGREYTNEKFVFEALDVLHKKHKITGIIEGGARGADTLGRLWGESRGIPVWEFRADWDKHGKAAGILRNQDMLDQGKPDAAVGFPGGRGTADMRSRIVKAGVKLWEPQEKT